MLPPWLVREDVPLHILDRFDVGLCIDIFQEPIWRGLGEQC
jgi:hypothetical protein